MTDTALPLDAADPNVRTADLPSISLWAERVREEVPQAAPLRWEPPSLDQVAAMLPDYEVVSFIGRGGMGAVFKARERAGGRTVAIKLLPPEASADERYRKRFQKEARVMEHLRHPRIVELYGVGQLDGVCSWFVMEYVDGSSLEEAVRDKSLAPEEARGILCDVCEALVYTHERGVIHRDLKPGNVLIDAAGRAKLADFGTAWWRPEGSVSQGTTGILFGTIDYMPPELLEEPGSDPRSDIYALGVMLYEMLCFAMPRGDFTPASERMGMSKRVDAVVSKAIQRKPEARYRTVAEMLRELEALDLSPEAKDAEARAAALACEKAARKRLAVWLWIVAGVLVAAGVAMDLLHAR